MACRGASAVGFIRFASKAMALVSEAPGVCYTLGMKRYHLTAVIWKEGRHYVSKCPELGVASFGSTPEKARIALGEAVELYIANARQVGLWEDVKPTLASETRYTTPLEIAVA